MKPVWIATVVVAVAACSAEAGDAPPVTLQDSAGIRIMMIRAAGLERPMDPAEVDALRTRRLESWPGDECLRTTRSMFDDVDLPEARPAFSVMTVDALQHLWVAEYETDADSVSGWHVFSSEGALLGRVAVPPGLRVHEIGADYVLGVQDNELDVPFVRRFPLTRWD